MLGLDGAIRAAEGANEDLVLGVDIIEQDTERRIRICADRCVDQIRVAAKTLIANLGERHSRNV
jgi:hypothetical protein